MTEYLWSKSKSEDADLEKVQQFMSGADVVLDREIFLYDIRATAAHASGLQLIGVLTEAELEQIQSALDQLARRFESGEFRLEPPTEDGHSAIEFWLTEQLGPVGKKVHTGRSRNDQVQVAMRMFLRDQMQTLADVSPGIAGACLQRAETDEKTPIPGYTHLQRAVPSSIGLWMGSFCEAFLDIADLAKGTKQWINCCPLGTAAGYGVNLALDRQHVSDRLEFERLQLNPMYVQNSRGRFALQALAVLAQATIELRRLCWDLSLYTSQEFGFVTLAEQFVTGSSIMPNKSNPDFVELGRAQHAVVQGAISELQSTLSLPSGYQRDLQLTKPPVIRAFGSSLLALELSVPLIETMQFDRKRMASAVGPQLHSTDMAIERVVNEGIPFREAYRQPASDEELGRRTPETSLDARVSPGACGDLQLDVLKQRLDAMRS
ncbi:MAG: argininosuccinate lyase [Pirellulaceae bacterium]